MSSTLTDLTAATTWSGTDLFYATVSGNSRKIAASSLFSRSGNILTAVGQLTLDCTTISTNVPGQLIIRGDTDTGQYANLRLDNSDSSKMWFFSHRDSNNFLFMGYNAGSFFMPVIIGLGAGGTPADVIINAPLAFAINYTSETPTVNTYLHGEASAVLAQRNSTTAQIFRVYRTWGDASNYERLALQTGSGYVELAAETAGTGTDNLDIRLTSAGTGGVKLNGSCGIYTGSGAPSFSATQGSIYLNLTGSSTSTRLYVNTTGSTTWTNFVTAA